MAAGLAAGEASLFIGGHTDSFDRSLRGTFVLGYALVAIAFALADRRFPRPLLRLGMISYSLYLTHKLVIHLIPATGSGILPGLIWLTVPVGLAEPGWWSAPR